MTQQIKMINFKTHLSPDPTYYFGNRITHELGKLIKQYDFDKVFLVTNDILLNLYGKELTNIFDQNAIPHIVVTIPDGEHHKNFSNLENLCEKLVQNQISKGSIIIGFGGGCLTNIVGLAAGLIFRGIRYIEMPTTLMGITDSTLSNKQAICGKTGKNQFGMYYAPIFLFGDTKYLLSESISGRKFCITEAIKNGFISDGNLLEYFDTKLDEDIAAYSEADLNELALKIIQSKLKILKRDPSEKRYGMTLEYGHTFGHAIEFFTDGQIPHGLSVAKGMCIAAELSHYLGYISQALVDKHYYFFQNKLGLDISIPEHMSVDDMMKSFLADNKKTASGVKYVLLKELGECLNPDGDYQVFVEPEIVRKVLTEYKNKHAYSSKIA
ncbi:MAG: hypothetical protein H6Q73_2359 [Firmicutes bacterium]|nr:hypothetical protein [Bacillota bacterium]